MALGECSFMCRVTEIILTPSIQVNRLERGHDTNVSGVWKEGVNGRGVTVAVVDDGKG